MIPGMFGLGMFGGAGAGMGVGDAGVGASAFDMQMCEIEVQAGDVSEIPGGEEEGLLLRNHHHHPHHHSHQQQQQQQQQHHAMAQFANLQAQQEQNAVFGSGANGFGQERTQWAQSQQSPAFSTLSVPSPPPGPQGMTINSRAANRSSLGSTPAGFMSAAPGRPTHSASNSVSSIYQNSGANGVDHAGAQEDFVVTSMSAPSHKQAFDHAGLYPPGILESAVSAGPNPNAAGASASAAAAAAAAAAAMAGPIRRHRSMTPSLIGRASGESIRRPMSTASNASGSGSGDATGSGSASPVPVPVSNVMGGMMGMGRGYHPYAGGYASSSRSGSTHSSPAVYNVPLGSAGGEQQQQQQQVRRSESRASFVAEQMMQGGAGAQEMFRTSSPGSFMPQHVAQMQATESPAPYTMELPPHQMYGHANTLPVGAYDAHVQQQQQQQQQEGGYYPQTHATL
ncbi:hypothetical protein P691DRAFT_779701 [Macrolepiota fuliginosa MF-IS2]|uniref:Uncharacterized protein n=1 Tax=Macrolepiota fuliginosa MF-IS2 TaxID=1400762 RepID=A0A9P5X1M9_9AGAR|nr:hypothetical protein P691DRAFT_779701 [Macrolepiota fuliginosa MF-IS2]